MKIRFGEKIYSLESVLALIKGGSSILALNISKMIYALIQARMSSSRLPGKVLLDLEGCPVLFHLIKRLKLAKMLDGYAVITSVSPWDDMIEGFCQEHAIPCFRGPLEDVLKRHIVAAHHFGADTIVRVPGDSPLVEPEYVDGAIELFVSKKLDYVSGKDKDHVPLGFGCEVVSLSALEYAWKNGTEPEDFEHVTWYILKNRREFKIDFLSVPDERRGYPFSLVLDTERDFQLLQEVFSRLMPVNPLFGLTEVINLYREVPSLFEINAKVTRNPDLFSRDAVLP